MKILNLLVAGEVGGIEVLCKNIIKISKEDHRICCLFGEGAIYNELKQSGEKVFSTVDKKGNLLKIEKMLYKYCKENKIDAVILHHGSVKGDIIFLMLMRKLKNVKFIRYNHGCIDKFTEKKNLLARVLANSIARKVLNKSNLNIYVSKASKQSFIDKIKIQDDEKNIVIYNGIPNQFFANKSIRNQGKITNITFVGRLENYKGIHILIEAFARVLKNRNNLKLIIVGKGSKYNQLKNMTKELKIEESVIFTGAKEDVIPILDKSKIFVYPSLWQEGFAISIIEAISRGCITIVTNSGGVPEIIDDGINGIITKPENLDKALDFALSLGEDKQKEMSENAKKKAKQFKIENTIEKIENAIRSIELH